MKGKMICIMIMTTLYPSLPVAAEYVAIVDWANRASLSLPVSGVVDSVTVTPGKQVKKGEVMLSLDRRYFEARLQTARSAMNRIKPGRDEAKRELDRSRELFERQVLSQVELDLVKNDFAEKEAAYAEAQGLYQQAKLDNEYRELRAPYDMVVLRSLVIPGQTVVNRFQAVPLVEVADAGRFMARFNAASADVKELSPGSAVSVISNGNKATATVSNLLLDQDRNHVAVSVAIEASSIPGLRAGHQVKVSW